MMTDTQLRQRANHTLRLVEATGANLDRIMELESEGFAPRHQELRSAYAQRIATFPQGALMAWFGADCVGCVFSEIWLATPELSANHFRLGHDIRERHRPQDGTELYISSMTLSHRVRGLGLGAELLKGCITHVAQAFPGVESVVLLVNTHWAAARRIYAGAGFVEVLCLRGFFSGANGEPEDGIVMRRPLRACWSAVGTYD